MAVRRLAWGAHRKGAPFAFLQGVLLLALLLLAQAATACPLDRADESVTVAFVFDGDTVKLTDGRKVRFIGINSTEINHDTGQAQPWARAARKRLMALLGSGALLLRYDSERHDRYGRVLAHPYLPDGRSISRILLDEGLAAAVVVPPNLWHSRCYLEHERAAREAGVGLWSGARFLEREARALRRGDGGFTLLRGRVEAVRESRRNLWLALEGKAVLRIPKSSLGDFTEYDPHTLAGRLVEARGWLAYHRGEWRMSVGHPLALRLR